MDKLNLNLRNCYGIKKFEHEFDFSDFTTTVIYAPNGAMKTSFAKTFQDLVNKVDSRDLLFPTRPTVREINKEDGTPLLSEEVFVIEPYNQEFSSEKMSTLLVNKTLKTKYDGILSKINEEKERFLKELKTASKFKTSLETEISLTFTSHDGDFFLSLQRVEREVLDGKEAEFANIVYNEIFNEKVHKFLKTEDFKDKIEQYITKYEELISKSKYFKKGVFNHNNASAIAKNLMDNGFFGAEHSVYLHSTGGDNQIRTKEELEEVIEEEKQNIINNPDLVRAFEEIDKELNANVDLRRFRDYLSQNPSILPELSGLNSFRQKLWVSYFKTNKELYTSLLKEYQSGEVELKDIAQQAKAEETNWKEVIGIFNERFSVPFILKIENQEDVILKLDVPNIVFEFKDSGGQTPVDKAELLRALSTGEKRALYILNIIFEVRARIENNQETLFLVDDIADSFDYKNKYAIIQYLRDISGSPLFRQIILTHNFDFFRTLESRFVKRTHCFTVEKSSTEIKLVGAEYIRNPFKVWMNNLTTNDKQLIASIPFTRNLIEYTKGTSDPDYLLLTSLLHIKADTKSITKADINRIYNLVFPNLPLVLSDPTKKIYDLLFELVNDCLVATESVNLENKILLSIAIRLRAEEFMFSKLTDKTEPAKKQTQILFERYREEFDAIPSEYLNITTLGKVDLMTPENIHLNSFMYEPILDMSDEHLKTLCQEVNTLV